MAIPLKETSELEINFQDDLNYDKQINWTHEEFDSICFWDIRLNKRLINIAQALSEQPGLPINQVYEGDWTDAKAAYDFFSNPKVSKEEIHKCHKEKTISRIRHEKTVLAINDSSSFNFTNHTKLKGKGRIGTGKQNSSGFLFHHVLMLTTDGIPLGDVYQEIWIRPEEIKKNASATNAKLPIEEKESYKWIKALHATHKVSKESNTRIIHIGDRESDLYEYFLEANRLGQEFVVRAQYDRSIDKGETDSEKTKLYRLWDHMESIPECGMKDLKIESKGSRPERDAKLSIRYTQVIFNPPIKQKSLPNIALNVILVREEGVNNDEITPVEWVLITNVAVNNIEDAKMIIEWYSCRWAIEDYHKIIKSGCKIESSRLESMDNLLIFFTIVSIVAWRIFYVTKKNIQSPEAPCTTILSTDEWKALYCRTHKTTKLPEELPTVRQAVRWIASLGGFLGRKGDKEPGITTIWRGFRRLNDIVEVWLLFQKCGQND